MHYGAATAKRYSEIPPGMTADFMARSQRQRLSSGGLACAFFVPWLYFCALYAVVAFGLHFTRPVFMWFTVFVGFGTILLCFIGAAWLAVEARRRGDADREPTWMLFVSLSMVLAFVAGIVLGNTNFNTYMKEYYELNNLNVYKQVNPATARGQTLMDAAQMEFTNNTILDVRRSMGFKNLDIYCVAPIVPANEAGPLPMESYDFWAVGLDCCSTGMADFHCGEYDSPGRSHGGLRVMEDEHRAFFRLAVQQAETAYNIKATHPLFLYWVRDPAGEMEQYRDEGYMWYFLGMIFHFLFQLVSVAFAARAFSKMRHV